VNADHEKLKRILAEAAAKATPAERAAYLDASCAGDARLRAEVERLLKAHERAGDFLQEPAVLSPQPTMVLATPPTEKPGDRIGHYKLLQQIGEGGCGVVYMAEQEEPIRRRVALKVIKLGMDTKQVIARFEAERQALALMDHPNIARVLDAGGTASGRPYFVMELVRGIPVNAFCDENALATAERLQLFIKVCRAISHAHQKGIIHRDLKPTNILVTVIDGEPVPKVIDFGVAKALGQKLTEKTLFTAFQQMIGTPAYMSPEQAALSAVEVDTRSDIYSLGVLLYELITGVTPLDQETFRRAAPEEIRRTICDDEPPKPSTRLRTLGPKLAEVARSRRTEPQSLPRLVRGDLDWIVMKCLDKDRRRRYEAASALAEDIERHLSHEPVHAGPPGAAYRARKFIRRHRIGVGMAVLAVATLAAGLAASLVGFAQAERERDRARAAEIEAAKRRDQAERIAAGAALVEGQSKLESGNQQGLLDMVEAFDLAKRDPEFRETVARRWSTWHAGWTRRSLAVRPMHGTPSPDYLQFASAYGSVSEASPTIRVYDTLDGRVVTGPLVLDSAVAACAFSADRLWLAALTASGRMHVWDRRTGALARPPYATGIEGLGAIEFSPCGRYLIARGRTENGGPSKVAFVRLRESESEAHILDHRYPVDDARFSPDGEVLAVQNRPQLQLWRTSDLRAMGPPMGVKFNGLLEFSRDGTLLAFNPSGSRGIALLDTRTLLVRRILPKEGADANRVAFSHNGRWLASFDWAGELELWDLPSGNRLYPARKVGGRISGDLSFNGDDSLLAVANTANRVVLLRTSDGELVHTLQLIEYPAATFLTNDVLVVRTWSRVHFWDLAAAALAVSPLPNDALATCLEFTPSGKFMAAGSERELRLWRMQPSPDLHQVVSMPGRVLAMAFSSEDRCFVVFTDDGSIARVDPATGGSTVRRNCGFGYEFAAALSPDGRRLVLYRFADLLLLNAQTGAVQPLDVAGGALSAAFRADSAMMTVGFADWRMRFYDVRSQAGNLSGESRLFEGWVERVAVHPDGNLLALSVEGSGVRLYDTERQRAIGSFRRNSLIKTEVLRFSPDGRLLAVAGPRSDGGQAVELWHVDRQQGLLASGLSLPHPHPIWSMAFSPDNATLAVGGLGTTRLWRLPPVPGDLDDVQSQTWGTLGLRRDAQRELVYASPRQAAAEQLRVRLTNNAPAPTPPLDTALVLGPAAKEAVLNQLAVENPKTRICQALLGRHHADLAVSNAVDGLWKEAAARADQAIRVGHADPITFYQRALFALGASDAVGYQATCRTMVDRCRSSNDPAVLKWAGWSAVLAPGALDDYAGLIERLRLARDRMSGWHGPAYGFYLGAVLLRSGQYREAAAELEQVNRHFKDQGAYVDFSPIYVEFLLAICHAHLGNADVARHWFATGCANLSNLIDQEQGTATAAKTTPWDRRLIHELLRKEAESTLNPADSAPPGPP
jgi:serine/threonine protein kinase/WD40 repeat protein